MSLSRVRQGGIGVAGAGSDCGSSRESAPQHLKDLGVAIVVAAWLARIFARSSIALVLLALSSPGPAPLRRTEENIEVEIVAGDVSDGDGRRLVKADRMPHSAHSATAASNSSCSHSRSRQTVRSHGHSTPQLERRGGV